MIASFYAYPFLGRAFNGPLSEAIHAPPLGVDAVRIQLI
jgi:hypothetical protein